jgi:hypothetical protein
MAVVVEMQNTGDLAQQRDVVAIVEHALSDRPGDWRVSIMGLKDSDQWEIKMGLSVPTLWRAAPGNMIRI